MSAPLQEVWEFHSTIDGLRALTPSWMHLEVRGVYGPDGAVDPDVLYEGSEIHMSIQPFGILPRQSWISRITDRTERDGAASFTDEMLGGPFPHWIHTHEFLGDGNETVLVDTVEYELPFGPIGELAEPFGGVGFEGMFRDRHRRTKARLESE